MGIIINRKSHECICSRDYNGGDEGNRTPVRKVFAKAFYERSCRFKIPLPQHPTTGYTVW